MRKLVQEGATNPSVRDRAQRIIALSPNEHPVSSLFRFVQSMPYVRDEQLAERIGADDAGEIIQGAPYQLELEAAGGRAAVLGDCDCRSVLLQSLLESQGIKTAFVLVRGPGRRDYSHVYSLAQIPGVGSVPLDTIMDGNEGRPFFNPGDEVKAPMARGRKVIPVNGSGSGVRLLAAGLLGLLILRRWA